MRTDNGRLLCIYLKSKVAPKTYTGFTTDVQKRLFEHNSGSNRYSSKFRPWVLFYFEKYDNKFSAIKREKYLKSHAGRKFMKRLFNNPE